MSFSTLSLAPAIWGKLPCTSGTGIRPCPGPREDTSNPSNTGKTLGKYRLLARLGQGGMAEVYLAVVAGPGGFNKLQVVKVMKPELLEEPEHRTMFLDEGRLAARLNHPNIVQTNEVQIEGDNHFIAMEYLDGQPLHRIVRRSKKAGEGPPIQWHLHIFCEVLSALEYAHTVTNYDGSPLAVVHRDVTPHNVFVTYAGQIKLCDFGIAKTMSSSIETRHGVLKGKVSYMAPEQVLSTRVDRRADLFAVGIMLWEAVTGQRMWHDQSDLQIMQALSQGQVPKARDVDPSVDPEIEQILDRALAVDSAGRYATASEFKKELENYLFSQTARIRPDAIGSWVGGLFEQERSNLQRVIQDQLSGSSSTPPLLDPPRPAAADSSPSRSGLAGSGQPGRSLTIPSVEVSGPTRKPKRSRGTLAALVGALAASVVFLLGIVIVLTLRARNAEPTIAGVEQVTGATGVAPTPPPPPETKPAEDKPKKVRMAVSVTPTKADLTLDGKKLDENPWKAEVNVDDKDHELVISAEGYESQTRKLQFDIAQRIEINLKKSKTKVATRVYVAPKKPEEKKPPEPPVKKPPGKALDPDDPW